MSLRPRPKGLPIKIPAWAWKWLKWRTHPVVTPPVPKPVPVPARPLVMYDDVNVTLLPLGAPAYAGYVDGHWQTVNALRQKFPNAHILDIAVFAIHDATCLDVETGDATIAEAPAWVKRQLARGIKPCVYTSLSQAQALVNALAKAGIKRTQYRLWLAHYTHVKHFCGPACGLGFTGRADATQWTDKALGRSLDESICAPDFF